jgi:hypothetical protein
MFNCPRGLFFFLTKVFSYTVTLGRLQADKYVSISDEKTNHDGGLCIKGYLNKRNNMEKVFLIPLRMELLKQTSICRERPIKK